MKFEVNIKEKTEIRIFPHFSDLKEFPIKADRYLIAADSLCAKKFPSILSKIRKKLKAPSFIVKLSAKRKDIYSLKPVFEFMLKSGFSRNSAVIAFGGGSTSDMAGLAAALFMRGLKFCTIPTTFLSQIDAAFGGKTAADINRYRNMLGCFKQPDLVLCFADIPGEDEIENSLGELVKYFFLSPESFPEDKARFISRIKKDLYFRSSCIKKCALIKMKVVINDPLDRGSGEREKLNLGHSAAHALEFASGGRISHGEAVMLGLEYEFILSRLHHKLKPSFEKKAKNYFRLSSGNYSLSNIRFEDFLKAAGRDKKNRGLKNKFFLFSPSGAILPAGEISKKMLKEAFERLKNEHTGN